ncbi:hypothetical protein DFH28DRAFT_1054294 [Melampsora americana]|nr:hypothetical protein DFH28DRAFT_1054294 [Melampsora americana]
MKSARILAPCGLLILCGLVDWIHSHPLEGNGVESIARNLKDKDQCNEANAVFADTLSGQKTAAPTKSDPFNGRVQDQYSELTGKTQKTSENSQDYKSMASDDARGTQTAKNSQTNQSNQGNKQTFVVKVKSFFTTWSAKLWQKIKYWFSKLNFSKSNDQKGINPSKENISMGVAKSEQKPGPGTGGASAPAPSEVSKDKSPAQAPFGESKVNPSKISNPNGMPHQAAAQKAQSYTNPRQGVRSNPTASQILRPKKPAHSDSSSPSAKSNVVTMFQPHNPRLDVVQPKIQFTAGPMTMGATASDFPAAAGRTWAQMYNSQERAAKYRDSLDIGKATKQSWNVDKADFKITPHGNDGSGTAQAKLSRQQIEVEVDPKTKSQSIRMSETTMQSSKYHGPGQLPNFAALVNGPNMVVPSHAIENQAKFVKTAPKKGLTWNTP